MSQQLSDFDTEHGLALLQNSTMQMLLAQHPNELPVHPRRARALRRGGAAGRAAEDRQGQPRAAAVDQRHPRPRARRRCASAPTEYWCFTSDQGADVPLRDAKLAEHDGDAWAAIAELARHGSQAARRPAPAELRRAVTVSQAAIAAPRRPRRRARRDRRARHAAPPRTRPARRRCWPCAACAAAPATSTLSYLIARFAVARGATGTCSSATPAARPAGWPPAPACSRRARCAEAADRVARGLPLRRRALRRRRAGERSAGASCA